MKKGTAVVLGFLLVALAITVAPSLADVVDDMWRDTVENQGLEGYESQEEEEESADVVDDMWRDTVENQDIKGYEPQQQEEEEGESEAAVYVVVGGIAVAVIVIAIWLLRKKQSY